jgi:hypothetical protein
VVISTVSDRGGVLSKKKIFVVMPFVTANSRDQASLTKFFDDYIKHPIETSSVLGSQYSVERSGTALAIVDQIVLDLAQADLVICDLSGMDANPNVMFELGLRLSTSHKPTILIREDASTNKKIFDIGGLYAHPYSITAPRDLERFLIEQINKYETGVLKYESPILKLLNQEAAFWMLLPVRKASAFLGGIASAAESSLRAISGGLSHHFSKKGKSFSLKSSDTVYASLISLGDKSVLDDFDYTISAIPSLDSYLSSVYLLGLIEDSVEKKFRAFAMSYSLYFNRGNATCFGETRYDQYVLFTAETLLLMNFARLLIQILGSREGSDERKKLSEQFFEQMKNSQIMREE